MISLPKGLKMDDLIMEQIVYSGTKLNIKYWIDDVDDEQQEEIHYFMESESDNIKMHSENLMEIMILMNCD
jgi:ATP-dependent DNA helicase RecQ